MHSATRKLGGGPGDRQRGQSNLKLKYHWAVADYLQRARGSIASKPTCCNRMPRPAVEYQGMNGVIADREAREHAEPLWWKSFRSNHEKMPRDFITADGFHITQKMPQLFVAAD